MQTTTEIKWHRVTKADPCRICGKPDWCTASEIGFCCMRMDSGRPMKNGGWLHKLDGSTPFIPRTYVEQDEVHLNVEERLAQWRSNRKTPIPVHPLSAMLGVTSRSLEVLDCCKAPQYRTWAFPMRAGDNSYTGIRLRNEDGEKWAEKGSKQGLFIPQCPSDPMALICEGPTDTAAALTMNYFAIGRPSCLGCVDHLVLAIKRLNIRRAVIVSDLDDAGLRGAKTLAEHLPIDTTILLCPAKDLRTFLNNGGNKEMLDAVINQQVWRKPNGNMDRSTS